jgi:hypothetical protein
MTKNELRAVVPGPLVFSVDSVVPCPALRERHAGKDADSSGGRLKEAIMRLLNIGCFALAGALACLLPAAAEVTCEDVRALSKADQEYWSQRLGLTQAQRHQIWVECYRHARGRRLATSPRRAGHGI